MLFFEVKPRRGERSDERSECKPDRAQPVRDGISRTYGAHARKGRNPRACARGYILSPLRGFKMIRKGNTYAIPTWNIGLGNGAFRPDGERAFRPGAHRRRPPRSGTI